MKQKNYSMDRKQQGFTLTELLIVVVILGILAYIVMRALSGNTDAAQATAIRSTAGEVAKGMGYIHANLGNGLDPTSSNTVAGTAAGMLAVLVDGESAVNASLKQRYVRLGMRPLSSEIRKDGGNYYVQNYQVTVEPCLGSSANRRVCTKFTNVTGPVAEVIAAKEGHEIVSPAGTSGTSSHVDTVHVSAASGGVHTVVFALVP